MTRDFHFPRNAFIGFDSILRELEQISSHAKDSYPPYNVVQSSENKYEIEVAVAGFAREDINIEVKEHVLTISGGREQRRPKEVFIHRGISTRKFSKSFRLSEYTEVKRADLNDGVLTIFLEVRTPEDRLPKQIAIG